MDDLHQRIRNARKWEGRFEMLAVCFAYAFLVSILGIGLAPLFGLVTFGLIMGWLVYRNRVEILINVGRNQARTVDMFVQALNKQKKKGGKND